MAYELLVGLYVTDNKNYLKYRKAMTPILKKHKGDFGYDFEVSKVLKSKISQPLNRVFTIYFESQESMNEFFKNPKYLEVKNKHFNSAVKHTEIIAEYHI
jgi:uncharacterized protein (DUF1330 family)